MGRRADAWSKLWDGVPPAPPPAWYDGKNIVRMRDFPDGALLAHALAAMAAFPSLGEAKRNGWSKPLAPGVYRVGKRMFGVVQS